MRKKTVINKATKTPKVVQKVDRLATARSLDDIDSPLKDFNQADGELAREPETLEEILGDFGSSPCGAKTTDEYRQILREMSVYDLQVHATDQGLVPISHREILTDRLVSQFNRKLAQTRVSRKETTQIDEPVDAKARRILREGE